jgi:hypothetical protein
LLLNTGSAGVTVVVLLWVLGLSLRGVCMALGAFGISLSHMSVWRDLQEQTDYLKKQRCWRPVRVLGLDGAYPLGWGEKRAVLIAVDLGRGHPVAIGYLDEANPDVVRRFLFITNLEKLPTIYVTNTLGKTS